jgi:mono/diheme cytochrome c family protein
VPRGYEFDLERTFRDAKAVLESGAARSGKYLVTIVAPNRSAFDSKELSMKYPMRLFQVAMLALLLSSFLPVRADANRSILDMSFRAGVAVSGGLPQTPNSAGWYTPEQAANGAKSYQKACANCHGSKLQGGAGPALVGRQFWLTYGGKKVSTLWSSVHTQMPMSAPGSVSAKNSTNIMAFLLQKNGVPSGTVPLDDTTDLSKVLPSK